MSKLPPPPFFVLRGHESSVSVLHFIEETDNIITTIPTLLSGTESGEIFIWNLNTFRTSYRFKGHNGKAILYLKYCNSSLLSHGRDGNLNVWEFQSNQWIITRQFSTPSSGFCQPEFFQCEKNISNFVIFNDGHHSLDINDCKHQKKLKQLPINKDFGMCWCLKATVIQGKVFLLAGYESGHIGLWDLISGIEVSHLKIHNEPVVCIDFDSQHKQKGASGSADPQAPLEIWTVTDLRLTKLQTVPINEAGVNALKIRQDGKILITGGSDFNVRVFSWKNLKLLAVLSFHEHPIRSLAFCPLPVGKQTSVFASGSKDKRISLWSLY